VLFRKDVGAKRFLIVDAAMNDWRARRCTTLIMRFIRCTIRKTGGFIADIVGPVCESGDYLARGRRIRLLEQGEGLVVATAGAYGYVMGSQYNSRPRPPEVLVHGQKWTVIRERETLEDLVRGEHIPVEL